MMAFHQVINLQMILVGFVTLMQGLEILRLQDLFKGTSSWSQDLLLREIGATRLQHGRGALRLGVCLFNDSFFRWLLVLQIIASVLCLVIPFLGADKSLSWSFGLLGFLFFVTLLTSVRWRGTVAGGADSMTLLILWTLSLAFWGHYCSSAWAKLPILYLGVQVCLSYCLAGLVKLAQPSWRKGEAIEVFLQRHALPRVRASFGEIALRNRKFLAWALISFELLFPLALLDRGALFVACVLGFGFHFLNFIILGLNRFLWSWLASYPALWVLLDTLELALT